MYIVDSRGKQIINSEFAERFCISEKDDAVLIVASYNDARPAVTMGRYKDAQDAQDALYQLLNALIGEQAVFHMPDRYEEQPIIKDARVKRRGGS